MSKTVNNERNIKKTCQLTLSQKRKTPKSRSVAVCIPSLFANNFNEAKNLFEYERCYLKILTGDKFNFPTQFSPLVESKMKTDVRNAWETRNVFIYVRCYQPYSNIFSKCFFKPLFFLISRKDLSGIISFMKISVSDKHDKCVYQHFNALFLHADIVSYL